MKFKKEDLIGLAYGSHDADVYKVIQKEIEETSRWSVHYSMVFEFEGKLYLTNYSIGATEMQDEDPYEYDDDEIECCEVEAYEATIIKFREVR